MRDAPRLMSQRHKDHYEHQEKHFFFLVILVAFVAMMIRPCGAS